MEGPSESGRDGIRILGSTLASRELRLASALESVSLADLAGAGDTGDTTGVAMEFSSTTTATFPTAEFLPIAAEDFMEAADSTEAEDSTEAAVFMAEMPEASAAANMDLRRHMASLAPIQAHSAALIMEVLREDFLLVGSLASAVASMEEVEVSTEAEAVMEAAVIDNPVPILRMQLMIWRENSCAQMI
jgi:hypothetical protein